MIMSKNGICPGQDHGVQVHNQKVFVVHFTYKLKVILNICVWHSKHPCKIENRTEKNKKCINYYL